MSNRGEERSEYAISMGRNPIGIYFPTWNIFVIDFKFKLKDRAITLYLLCDVWNSSPSPFQKFRRADVAFGRRDGVIFQGRRAALKKRRLFSLPLKNARSYKRPLIRLPINK